MPNLNRLLPRFCLPLLAAICASVGCAQTSQSKLAEPLATRPAPTPIIVRETDDAVEIETDALSATIRKSGYVSGVAAGSLLDKRTGARDLGFGLHVMDFLMAPGWRDDGYERDPKLHGDLPKHYVEGPQICTQAKRLPVEVVRGVDFVAVKLRFTFHQPGKGYKAGSTWEQTLVFRPGLRYVLSAETIVSANDADNVFYRIDMPGHIKGDRFAQVYLSYGGKPDATGTGEGQLIPADALAADFGPDERFLYRRQDDAVPRRMIRAYQVKRDGAAGPWLAGMTLDPAAVCEAWCHRRGYVSFIQELHGRKVSAGQTIGSAYAVGWFDSVDEMNRTYDALKGTTRLSVEGDKLSLK